jgi:antirestriction protein ArdC
MPMTRGEGDTQHYSGPNRCLACGQFAGVGHTCPHSGAGEGGGDVPSFTASSSPVAIRPVGEVAVRRETVGGCGGDARVGAGLAALRRRREGMGAPGGGVAEGKGGVRLARQEAIAHDVPSDAGVPRDQQHCAGCGQFVGEQGHQCPVPEGMPAGDYADLKGEDRTTAMLADLQGAVASIVESGQLRRWLDAMAGNGLHRWSMNNRLLALVQLAQRGESIEGAHLMGFRQWEGMNRHVRKGERAVWILAPMTRKLVEDDENGQRKERVIVTGFRGVPVFNVTQTDGDPLPSLPVAAPPGEATPGTVEGLRSRVAKAGYVYREEEIPGCDPVAGSGTLGYTTGTSKEVVIDSRLNGAQKAAVLAHELGHVHCGHIECGIQEYRTHRGRMETEAEMTAYLVSRARGMDRGDADSFAAGYIASWSQGDQGMIVAAMERATKAFNTIMEGDWS